MLNLVRVLAFLILGCGQAFAVVANQACTPAVGSTTARYFTSNTTFSFTNVTVAAGTNLALTVVILFDAPGSNSPAVTSMTWDAAGANQAMVRTNVGSGVAISGNVEIWTLINPTAGVNKTISIAVSPTSALYTQACVWTGVDQTGGATSFPHSTFAGGATTVTIASATGNVVIAGATSGVVPTGVMGTTLVSDTSSGTIFNIYSSYMAGAASVVIGSTSNNNVISAIDIKAAAGGGGITCNGGLPAMGAGVC
jgi:hypothetical protein